MVRGVRTYSLKGWFIHMLSKFSHQAGEIAWGVATAAYQIEGSVRADGRGPSIWDTFCKTPGKIVTGDTGDVACDHYRRYPEDIAIMQDLGIEHYRFSVSFSRIFPDGRTRNVRALDFYERLVEDLLVAGIRPAVTLYHWDLPQALQEQGGWASRDTAFRFAEYASEVYARLGDRVQTFITHNEPWCTAFLGHLSGEHAPGIQDPQVAANVGHNLLLSHGLAVRAYREAGCKGDIGITLNLTPAEPATDSAEDVEAVAAFDAFANGWFINPLCGRSYPSRLLQVLGAQPANVQTEDEGVICAKMDFIGVNYYSYAVVAHDASARQGFCHVTPRDRVTQMGWPVNAHALVGLLERVTREFALPVYVTENGAAYEDSLADERVHDAERIAYIAEHVAAVCAARAAGVDVKGYYLWTLLDNFEWQFGYSRRFGIVHVDFATGRRRLKDSADFYRNWIASARSIAQQSNDTPVAEAGAIGAVIERGEG
jgi:beta-glucosidase